jgi:hypothetical protein
VRRLNLWPLLEQLSIKTKSGQIIKLDRNDPEYGPAQRAYVAKIEHDYNAGLPLRFIILKARQLGLSTITEAVLFLLCFIHPATNALVLSKERDDSNYLFSMTKRYWELGPFRQHFNTRYDREGYLEWSGIESSFISDTANKKDPGRGKTIRAVHASEVAFWEEEIDVSGLMESVPDEPGTIIVLESTANGVGGLFYDVWQDACDPESDSSFTPMFFPWFKHDPYTIANHHLSFEDLEAEERAIIEAFPRDVTLGKLAWRRRKIASIGIDKFHENYPCTPEEAFLSTGSNVFDMEDLRHCYKELPCDHGFLYSDNGRVAFREDPDGKLSVYKYPDQRGKRQYAVALDPTLTLTGDPACIQVLDRATLEQVAVWWGHTDPKSLGNIAMMLGYFYNTAMLNTEVQGGGLAVIEVWRTNGYPNIWFDRRPDKVRTSNAVMCWSMSQRNKEWAIGTTKSYVGRHALLLHHYGTYYEMSQYIVDENGDFGPARRSGHDDTVTSLMIGVMTVMTEQLYMDWQAVADADITSVPAGVSMAQGRPYVANYGTPVLSPSGARFSDQYADGYSLVVPGEIDDWW